MEMHIGTFRNNNSREARFFKNTPRILSFGIFDQDRYARCTIVGEICSGKTIVYI